MILEGLWEPLVELLGLILASLLVYIKGRADGSVKAENAAFKKALKFHREADLIDSRNMPTRDAIAELRRRSRN